MAHFAELNDDNIVLRVVVISNQDILDVDGNESEAVGIGFCQNLYGQNTKWVQTSYNASFRKRYAGIGFYFDADKNAFIEPQPFSSWLLNEETLAWEPPTPYPGDPSNLAQRYDWDEPTLSWVLNDNI